MSKNRQESEGEREVECEVFVPKDVAAGLKPAWKRPMHWAGFLVVGATTRLPMSRLTPREVIGTIEKEIKRFAGVKRATYLHHFLIPQALPDRTDLRMTTAPEDLFVQDNVVLAGDHLLNGSLNAAMESGYLAAQALQQQR